jgi:hypothetical protein
VCTDAPGGWLLSPVAAGADPGDPLDWQPDWLARVPQPNVSHCLLSSAACGSVAVIETSGSRALPGHRIWRVRRFPCDRVAGDVEQRIAAIADAAFGTPRVLRCQLQLFALDAEHLGRAAAAAKAAGFRHGRPESYTRTVLLDLTGSEDDVLRRFGGSARRGLRKTAASGLEVHPVTDPAFALRLAELEAVTRARTGGRYRTQNWRGWLDFVRTRPEQARIAGLFRGAGREPEHLLSYALGCRHAGVVEYRAAASMRSPELTVPLAYAPAWELMRWARDLGVGIFDFGGVTASAPEHADAQARISQFKQHFGKTVSRVAEEWVLEPRPLRSRLARALSRLAG